MELISMCVIKNCAGYLFTLVTLCIGLSVGYITIDITPKTGSVSGSFLCNETVEYTQAISQMTIGEKTPEPTDKCYCMIYHPTNQQLLQNLTVVVQNILPGESVLKTWNTIPRIDWWREEYKVPVFNIQPGYNTQTGYIRNSFHTYILNGQESTLRTYVPVVVLFQRLGGLLGSFTEPIHLICDPNNYVQPAVLRPQTTAIPPTTIASDTTPTTYTTSGTNVTNNTTPNTANPSSGKNTDDDDEDNTLLIAVVVGVLGALLLILLIILCLGIIHKSRKNRQKNPAVKNYNHHHSYYADINHNGIEDQQEVSNHGNHNGGVPPNHTYANAVFQPDLNHVQQTEPDDIDRNELTNQNTRHVHYAEVEVTPSAESRSHGNGVSQRTDQVTYADIAFQPQQQGSEVTDNAGGGGSDQQAAPIYAKPMKKQPQL